jgi:prepilin-type N-terminal cleavage/methylation domain-containing protein
MSNKKGFSIVEVLIVVAVLAIIGLLGWTYYGKFFGGETSSQEAATASVPQVETSNDLQKTIDAVNAIDVDKNVDTSDITAVLE